MTASTKTVAVGSEREKRRWRQRALAILALLSPAILLLLFAFVLPVGVLFSYSAFHFTGINIIYDVTFEAYGQFFGDPFFYDVVALSLRLAAFVTLIAVLIGYPTAYAISRLRSTTVMMTMYVLIFSPILTSVVIRAFGWLIMLGERGFVNYVMTGIGLWDKPIRLVYNVEGVTIALVHVMLPFCIFPIVSVMNQLDPTLKEAASDLGANRWTTFWRVTWPLTLPGLVSGAQTTFVLAISAFATPTLLGGGRVNVLPRMIYEGIVTRDWPIAGVMGIVLLTMSLTIIFVSNKLFRMAYKNLQEQG
jgi:putative spermidine/putrescine transport system permease protein